MRLFSRLRSRTLCRTRRVTAPALRPQLEALDRREVPSAGAVDPTFGSAGFSFNDVNGVNDSYARAIAAYPSTGSVNDGKVVEAGSTFSGIALSRYTTTGAPDLTFGTKGNVVFTTVSVDAEDVQVQPDGKVVTAGWMNSGGSFGNDFAVVRFNADGTLDTTFGGKGKGIAATDFNKSGDRAFGVQIQPDGKILAAGWTSTTNTSYSLGLVRYTSAGTLDTAFGAGGKVTLPLPAAVAGAHQMMGMALVTGTGSTDPNRGKVVVAVQLQNSSLLVARFNPNGSLDTATFGRGAGYVVINNTLSVWSSTAVAVQADDRIVLTGPSLDPVSGYRDFGVARLNADGTPDTTFGANGFVFTPSTSTDNPRSVNIQADGRIVVVGDHAGSNTFQDIMVARYNSPDGSLDASFGTNGVEYVPTSPNSVGVYVPQGGPDSVLMPDGRLAVSGTYVTAGSRRPDFFAARFLMSSPQIGSFWASAPNVTAGGAETLTVSGITDNNPGATVTRVDFYYLDANGARQLLGTGTQTSSGVWTLTFTVALPPGTYTLLAQATDSYGVIGDPIALPLTVL